MYLEGGLTKNTVQELDFIPPVFMYPLLSFREEEALSRIKASPHGPEPTIFPRDLYDPVQTQEVEGRTACFQDQEVWSYE